MNTGEKANFILDTLERLFPNPLSGLNVLNNFTHLVAVILSAQCTDAMVNRVTKSLFAQADSPEKMLALGDDKLREIIHPCGFFNNKSKAILATSQILVDKFNGEVPCSFEELEKLPGVGHKTASVVMSQCFGVPAFPVDTHIARLANRWKLVNSPNVAIIEKCLKSIFPRHTWSKLHLQLVLYGRTFCPAKRHEIDKCPICLKFFGKK